MELKTFFAQDLMGNVIPSPVVTVYQPGTTTLATGLQTASGTALTNPFNGTLNGQVTLAAPDGDYDMRIDGAGRSSTLRVRFIDSVAGSAEILRLDLASTAAGKGVDLVAGAAKSADLASSATGKGGALVAFKQAGTGAVTRTAQDKMRESVSVKDFGTNTAAVQAAINSLGAGGGFVLVNRGVSYTFASLTLPENVTLFDEANNRIVFHDAAIEDGNATNLLIRSPIAGATRVHIEPRGNLDSGTTSKLDWMHDPFQEDSSNYRIFNVYTVTGDPYGTGEGAICALNAKSVGNFWGNWPSMQFGFQDLGTEAVCAKVWFGEHGAPQHYAPMKGAWRIGKTVTAGDYVTASNMIYQAASSGACGATVPTHTSGTVSDGAVNWLFVRAPSSSTIRATFLFGNRSQMPVLGYPNARVQFGTETVTHWGASHKYVSSTGSLIADIRTGGSAGSETLEIGVSGGGYTRWFQSQNFVQNVGLALCASVVSATNGATTPSVAGVETLSFANTSATTVTALSGGRGGQRVRLVSTNGNTTIAHTVATSGGVIRNASGANIVMSVDGALDLERHPSADFWRVVGVGY